MGKLTGKVRNSVTQLYADRFTQQDIMQQSLGQHDGEPMARIYRRIMTDPNIRQAATKKPGVFDLVFMKDGKVAVVGWMDANRGMGEISQKAYDHVHDFENDGCYIVPKDDQYAVKVYGDAFGRKGKFAVEHPDSESGQTHFTFSDKDSTLYETYQEAAGAASRVSDYMNISPSYDAAGLDMNYAGSIPSADGLDLHLLNAGGEYDMESDFRFDGPEDGSQFGG